MVEVVRVYEGEYRRICGELETIVYTVRKGLGVGLGAYVAIPNDVRGLRIALSLVKSGLSYDHLVTGVFRLPEGVPVVFSTMRVYGDVPRGGGPFCWHDWVVAYAKVLCQLDQEEAIVCKRVSRGHEIKVCIQHDRRRPAQRAVVADYIIAFRSLGYNINFIYNGKSPRVFVFVLVQRG